MEECFKEMEEGLNLRRQINKGAMEENVNSKFYLTCEEKWRRIYEERLALCG